MSAYGAMYHHRYGQNPASPSSDQVGDAVAAEMFGQDSPPGYPSLAPTFTAAPATGWETQVSPAVRDTVRYFLSIVQQALPGVQSYHVQGGRDSAGNTYAQLTVNARDPHRWLERAASAALKSAQRYGVSVATKDGTMPDQVVLVFTKGVVP